MNLEGVGWGVSFFCLFLFLHRILDSLWILHTFSTFEDFSSRWDAESIYTHTYGVELTCDGII